MVEQSESTQCCIVGSGPGGAVLALLLARRGIAVRLLESHSDFNREFRGDTIHPSTLDLMRQLSLLDSLLEIPHTRVQTVALNCRTRSITYLDFRRLQSPYPYVLGMSQPRVLEFLTDQASRYPNFRLQMGARVEQLIEESGCVTGVRYRCGSGLHELRANLVVGADGRFSRVRELGRLPRTTSAQPIDLLWFRLPRVATDPNEGGLFVRGNRFAFIRNRGEAWQVAYMLPKGDYQRLRAAGLQAVRCFVAEVVPWLHDRASLLEDWRQTSFLSVESSRVRRWCRPGLLLIGDAAHVMSPVGGVGINLAIQDAVATANLVGPHLRNGSPGIDQLATVQRRRELPTRLIQLFQDLLLQYILSCDGRVSTRQVPGRLVEHVPALRALRTRLFAFGGFGPEWHADCRGPIQPQA
jgi:2-polyprenyl-6-methoxyphenol hydroxylase-like FAD-dependent oxidoreductase